MTRTNFARAAAAAGLILRLAAPASAVSRSTFTISVNPNLELLGVVQRLADAPAAPADEYQKDVDAAFARFKSHPAVRLYVENRKSVGGRDGFGIDLLYYTSAPELALKVPSSRPPYLNDGAPKDILPRFLEALRDLSDKSDFPRFFRQHHPLYDRIEAAARGRLGAVDPVSRIEAYLGVGLESRCRYLLTPLYRNESLSSFIEPYPDPRARTGPLKEPFEVYTITPYDVSSAGEEPRTDLGRPGGRLWQEPLYVFIDPSFYFFLAANAPDPASFFRLDVPGCPPQAVNCAKALVVQALVDRLNSGAYGAPANAGDGERARFLRALEARLEEYERKRDVYPTLWSFYPRLFEVFRELSPDGSTAAPLRLPGGRIAKTTDFFDPAMRGEARRAR